MFGIYSNQQTTRVILLVSRHVCVSSLSLMSDWIFTFTTLPLATKLHKNLIQYNPLLNRKTN